MIISVYGIPRSGKDTFIEQVIKSKRNAYHLKGSKTLNELAYQKYNRKFRELRSEEQEKVRVLFTEHAKELDGHYDLVIVDGHYSFPSEHGFYSVFTEADLNLYDAFFYLKRNSDEIVRNFDSGDKKDYSDYLLSKEKVDEWIEYEINSMQSIVEAQDKDFIVLDSDKKATDYVCEFVKTSQDISREIADKISSTAKGKNVVLTDLDKTVSINDLTDDFLEYSKISPELPKKIFGGDYYTAYQFYIFHDKLINAANYNEAADYALKKLVLNENVVNDLAVLKKEGCVVALTTGIKDVWDKKNKELQVFDCIFGFDGKDKLIITPLIKKLVSKYLSSSYNVIAIGDSVIDLGMVLNAAKGYLVAMNKLDKRIIAKYDEGKINKTLMQPKYSNFKYKFAKEAEIKW